MRKLLLALALIPLLASCGETPAPTTVDETSTETSKITSVESNETTSEVTSSISSEENSSEISTVKIVKYTVTFAGTNMPSVQIEEGKQLNRPSDPKKDGYLFTNWYMDAEYTTEVSFPLTIISDTTIYAKFYSYTDAFQKARANTIGDTIPGYEYDYTLTVSATYMGIAFNGNALGNTKYSKNSEVRFYDNHENSGSLFYDGTKYEILRGSSLHEISLDQNAVMKQHKIKEVGEDYKYDSSSFAKPLFEFDDSKIKKIEKTSVANEYKIDTTFRFSDGVALVSNYVNHPAIEALLGSLPETSGKTGVYASFNSDKLSAYRYQMTVDVSDFKFNLDYKLTFKNVGKAPTINPKTFSGAAITDSDIASIKSEVSTYINSYKALAHSSYDFKIKTGVDFVKKNEINATIDGFTKRKVSGSTVYYLNDYEVDTDHKNADLYKSTGLGDCHGGRVKLSTGEVHDLKKKAVLSGYTDVGVATHTNVDNYYLFDILDNLKSITFIQKQSKSSGITYAIGGDDKSAIQVLNYFNNNLRLNPLKESTADVKAFGSFSTSSVKVKDFKFNIVIEGGNLSAINLTMNGGFRASFPGSRDFTVAADAGFKLNYTLKVTTDGASYEPASAVKDVK